MAKPEPKIVSEVCSLCGLDWDLHGKNPTSEVCVKLLLDEVSSLNARLAHRPISYHIPYPAPYPVYPRPYYPHWYSTTWGGNSNLSVSGNQTASYTSLSSLSPQAISIKT